MKNIFLMEKGYKERGNGGDTKKAKTIFLGGVIRGGENIRAVQEPK
jgi:hypothetical protein